MKKLLTAVFILLTLVLSACAVQPQETTAPTETTALTQPTEATQPTEPPTQPTEATKPTEPPTQPTEPPTQPTEPTEPTYKNDGLVNAREEVTDYSIKMAYCDLIVPEIVGSKYTGQLFETADGLSKFITARCNTPELGTKAKNDICPKTFEEVGAALLAETDFAVSNVAVFYVLGTPDALPDITKVEYVDYTIDSTVGSVKSFMISLTNFGAVVGDLSQVKYYQVFITVPKTYEIPKTQPEYPFVPTFLNRVSK